MGELVVPELQFPARCPSCNYLLMDSSTGKHCPGKHCSWLRCACGATVNQAGRFFLPPSKGA